MSAALPVSIRTVSWIVFRSTLPRCLSIQPTSAWSSGSVPKMSGGGLSKSGRTVWMTRSRS